LYYGIQHWKSLNITGIILRHTALEIIEHYWYYTTAYSTGNPGLGLGQPQNCGRVKLVNGIPTLLLLIIRFPTTTQTIKLATDSLPDPLILRMVISGEVSLTHTNNKTLHRFTS
jgi:hypothetical protein